MADNNNSQFIVEGASLTRSPGFTREDYPYWKDKIEMYIKFNPYKLWLIITNGDIPIPRPCHNGAKHKSSLYSNM
ncbi:hypothetical protein JHK82_050688 [Glycine max]|uniref:Uncharacterized protein n=2 Tax=Glycine subgen. Soja TaxID=1462606 RepID=A0A0R0F929_SOYBN|nr:hypothetical protein JHK86_050554 [Glycine max]KAG4924833.1 hypothetical protein JHK87_050373 [Glycine soja]KAG4936477.1 hypothetical protein JHK85_051396 [Glycine max]KAG5091910.1 hypothetical protein JHK82_050688 [Glycine max]KAG5095003.1 hypothetical protein JHK84_050591 [Glycine max]